MKLIKLTKGQFAKVDDWNYDWVDYFNWHAQEFKEKKLFYARSNMAGQMHRFIMHINNPNIFIDHADGDGLNNQEYNLRIADRSQNSSNRIPKAEKSCKYLGVSFLKDKNKFRARIKKFNNITNLGYFRSAEDAALAYNEAAKRIHGEFAHLNIIP